MVLPGCFPGYKSSDIQLLPSIMTNNRVWELNQEAAGVQSMRPSHWLLHVHKAVAVTLPHVVVMKPMSDLCWLCQCNSTAITRSANRPDEKSTCACAGRGDKGREGPCA